MKKLFAAVALAMFVAVGPARAEPLTFGVTGQGTTIYTMGAALAKVLEDNGMQIRLQPMGGATAYTPLFGTDEIDIGIVNINVLTAAWRGERPFKEANKDVRLLSVLYPFTVGLMVRADSDIMTVADVKGRTLPGGFTQMPYINPIIRALLGSAGLTYDDVEVVPVPTIGRALDDFDAGRIDVGYFGIGGGRVAQSDAAVGGIRFLPVPSDDAAVEAMNQHIRGAFVRTLPAGSFVGIEKETTAMAYDMMLATGSNVPEEVIAEITKIMFNNKDAMAEGFGGFRGFDPMQMAKPSYEVPYHTGTISYLQTQNAYNQ